MFQRSIPRTLADKLQRELQRHHFPHGRVPKVSQLIEEYRQSVKYKSLGRNSKSTYSSIFNLLEKFSDAGGTKLHDMRVHDVDFAYVDYFIAALNNELAPATIRMTVTVLGNIWQLAIRHGRAITNPWRKPGIKVRNERDVTWTREEVDSAITKAQELKYHVLALYLILMYETGQRPWEDIRNWQWTNIKNIGGISALEFRISKTSQDLSIPISKRALEALDKVPKVSKYICVDLNGNIVSASGIAKQFEHVRKEAGLSADLQFRDLRRTLATELAQSGASFEEIRAMFGWKDASKMMARYARLRLTTAVNGMEKRELQRQRSTEEDTNKPEVS